MAKDQSLSLPDPMTRGGYVARFASDTQDFVAAQRLRHRCFIQAAGLPSCPEGREADRFDEAYDHVLVEDSQGEVQCCFRVRAFGSGAALDDSYSAQFYGLDRFGSYHAPMIELGRFCVHPMARDGDVLRIAWAMLAAYVDSHGAGILFGCSSFAGTDPARYSAAFDLLASRHLAPMQYRAEIKATEVVRFSMNAMVGFSPRVDHRTAMAQVPSLLRTYLSMGGWVSDHAVIDRDLQTLHVFTGLDIAAIPPARAQALRSV